MDSTIIDHIPRVSVNAFTVQHASHIGLYQILFILNAEHVLFPIKGIP